VLFGRGASFNCSVTMQLWRVEIERQAGRLAAFENFFVRHSVEILLPSTRSRSEAVVSKFNKGECSALL
jgi:hypothetical protein